MQHGVIENQYGEMVPKTKIIAEFLGQHPEYQLAGQDHLLQMMEMQRVKAGEPVLIGPDGFSTLRLDGDTLTPVVLLAAQ